MKNSRMKTISKVMIFVMIFSMNMAITPGMGLAVRRLTSAKDILSRTQASGTGFNVAGYTESTQEITDNFVIDNLDNNVICTDFQGGTVTAVCNGPNDVRVDLITHGGAIENRHYTGKELAAIIATALAAADGDIDDSYTVIYSESADTFSIRADGGNTLNPYIGWSTYTGADNANKMLGYTADDPAIRNSVATSDVAVAFYVDADINNRFFISVDQKTAVPVTIGEGTYTANTLVTEMDTRIDAASTKFVTVSYANDKFRITSNDRGAQSSIVITEGINDFLRTVRLVGDVPVDGTNVAGIISADHTISFVLAANVAAADTIVVTFPTGFGLTGINHEDIDMSGSIIGEVILGATASLTTWGATVSGQVLTFTSGTGTLTSGETITIEIGRHATAGFIGTRQISNPTTVGLYEITIETRTGLTVNQDAKIAVYIVSDDSVVVKATVDPILSFAIQGGTELDIGTLEPNAYHKLGGARSAHGTITLTNVIIDGVLDAETVTVNGNRYEFSDDGVITGTSKAMVMIVDNRNNYLSAAQVAANLYRAINNYDGALVRANIDARTNTLVNVVATGSGTIGNSYTLAETVTNPNFTVSGANFTGGAAGYNNRATSVDYAGGSDVGNGQTGNNLVISTNSVGGYVISIQNTDSNGVNNNSDGLTNGTVEIKEWTTGTYGYGILASAQSARYGNGTSNIIASAFQGDGTGDLPEAMSITAATLASYSGTVANDNIGVEYNVRIDASQAAGQYTDIITYICTTTY